MREAGGRRSAGCGYHRLPYFNGMRLFDTDTMDPDDVTDARSVLAACAARGSPEWPSEWPPAAQDPGTASHTCVPLAISSADHFFGQPPPALGAQRVEGGLGAACVTRTTRHRQPQKAVVRVSRGVRG